MLYAIKCEKLQIHTAKGIIYWSENLAQLWLRKIFLTLDNQAHVGEKKKVPRSETGQHFRWEKACFEKARGVRQRKDDSFNYCPSLQVTPMKLLVIKQSDGNGVSVLDGHPLCCCLWCSKCSPPPPDTLKKEDIFGQSDVFLKNAVTNFCRVFVDFLCPSFSYVSREQSMLRITQCHVEFGWHFHSLPVFVRHV